MIAPHRYSERWQATCLSVLVRMVAVMFDARASSVGRYRARCAPGDCLVAAEPATSKLETDTFLLLNHVLGNGRQHYKVNGELRPADMAFRLKKDLFDNEMVLVVEFDAEYWHREGADRDAKKAAMIEAMGPYRVVRIREAPLKRLDVQDVVVPSKSDAITCSKLVLLHITHTIYEVSTDFDLFDRIEHYLKSAAILADENSVACCDCRCLVRALRDGKRGSFLELVGRVGRTSRGTRYDRWRAASHHRTLKKRSA